MSMVSCPLLLLFFFFNDTATTEIYTLSLHDALPISNPKLLGAPANPGGGAPREACRMPGRPRINAGDYMSTTLGVERDRKSTRLNSSHSQISYAVFCLKKKKTDKGRRSQHTHCMTAA